MLRRSAPTPLIKTDSSSRAGNMRARFGFGRDKRVEEAVEAGRQSGRLSERMKYVLERDRALVPEPVPELVDPAHDDVHEVWPDPASFGHTAVPPDKLEVLADDYEEHFAPPEETGTRPTERALLESALEQAEAGIPPEHQFSSWIEDILGDAPLAEESPVAIQPPLNAAEAAELDQTLAELDSPFRDSLLNEDFVEAPIPDEVTVVSAPASVQVAIASAEAMVAESQPAPRPLPAPNPLAQVKAKVSAPAEDDEDLVGKEPIVTRTMARLLGMQGQKPRALAVYRELLKRTPHDTELRAEYETLIAS